MIAVGIYAVMSDQMVLQSSRAGKAVRAIGRREQKKSKKLESVVNEIATTCAKFIRLTDYKRRKLAATLRSANMDETPEMYLAKAWVKAGMILLGIVPAFLILPMVSIVMVALAITVYFKEIRRADELVRSSREHIEFELPRFVATLTQDLKASRNVVSILESYKQNAGDIFKRELEVTIADMKSGSYESALMRLETRIGSSKLSDIIRGLAGVLQGDDGVVYFQMLSHDLKQLQLQRLKGIAMKRPAKIHKYSFALLFCFLFMYLAVMTIEIVKTLGTMF